jgi:ADP-glucose pyrophosphorylase
LEDKKMRFGLIKIDYNNRIIILEKYKKNKKYLDILNKNEFLKLGLFCMSKQLLNII